VKAVDDSCFHVCDGETLGIIGESGCGKSVTALSIMGLIRRPRGIVEGNILFDGADLTRLSRKAMEDLRGCEIAMIFQEPMTSLHPMHQCGYQLVETVLRHQRVDKKTAYEKAEHLFKLVGIPDPARIIKTYPHELSGGMSSAAV
jgi:oligopeptide transport system ATP-binding protein